MLMYQNGDYGFYWTERRLRVNQNATRYSDLAEYRTNRQLLGTRMYNVSEYFIQNKKRDDQGHRRGWKDGRVQVVVN